MYEYRKLYAFDRDNIESATHLIKSIQNNWKLDAKLERIEDYFYITDEYDKIMNGSKFYIIGRKGSGKSAIAEYISNTQTANMFSKKLSFKNFPFNTLYSCENPDFTRPNQYISLWKLIIYTHIGRLMLKDHSISSHSYETLRKIFPFEDCENVDKEINKTVIKSFNLNLLGTGGGIECSKTNSYDMLNFYQKIEILEPIIKNEIGKNKYFILFDELDEDFKAFETQKEKNDYLNLITSLFKATQDIKSIFKNNIHQICPIIFLRNDIYNLIEDSDKNKWEDFSIRIEWGSQKIKKLLAHRLSKTLELEEVLPFEIIWNKLFSKEKMILGGNKKRRIQIFDYISRSTQMRPRDFVKLITACASVASEENYKFIGPSAVKKADKKFSIYFRDELVDEIQGYIPEIRKIFTILSTFHKWAFSFKEFKTAYDEQFNSNPNKLDVTFVLEKLFDFSVIGNSPKYGRSSHEFFKYTNPDATFNYKDTIIVHRGLFKSLQII